MNPLVIYHDDCADGFTACWVAARAFKRRGIEVDLHRGVYNAAPPDCTGREVYLVDFSYSRPVVEAMAAVAESVTILDHHESAWKEWGVMEEGGSLSFFDGKNLHAHFEKNQSGAAVAWDNFNPANEDMEANLLVQYVMDRDLWRFDLPNSHAVNAWIFSWEYNMANWDMMATQLNTHSTYGRLVIEGQAIRRKQDKDIREFLAKGTNTMIIGGTPVLVTNVPYHWGSDAAHILAEGQPFAAYYWDRDDGRRVFGLRSSQNGENVATIAKVYGGGGHQHASGFTMPMGWEGEDAVSI
jgi:oligoribonuclease NrnB/cAMP/cGMP phosphodiesterase (DHH superfamily)